MFGKGLVMYKARILPNTNITHDRTVCRWPSADSGWNIGTQGHILEQSHEGRNMLDIRSLSNAGHSIFMKRCATNCLSMEVLHTTNACHKPWENTRKYLHLITFNYMTHLEYHLQPRGCWHCLPTSATMCLPGIDPLGLPQPPCNIIREGLQSSRYINKIHATSYTSAAQKGQAMTALFSCFGRRGLPCCW